VAKIRAGLEERVAAISKRLQEEQTLALKATSEKTSAAEKAATAATAAAAAAEQAAKSAAETAASKAPAGESDDRE
jgi:hypothetical protein